MALPSALAKRGYERLGIIGKGNFGKIYKVRCPQDGREYVLKKVPAMSVEEVEGAMQEVKLLASLNHPNVVRYKEAFHDDEENDLCLIMDYCEGGDLSTYLKRMLDEGQNVPEASIWRWLCQLLLALDYLYSCRVLHRDIKSQNIFLSGSPPRLLIGDFGVAKQLDATLEMAKTPIGTPYTMAPEMFNGKPYSFKGDMWALGCVIYEACCYKQPFAGSSFGNVAMKVMNKDPEPLPDRLSEELRGVISQLLCRDSRRRPLASDLLHTPRLRQLAEAYIAEVEREGRYEGGTWRHGLMISSPDEEDSGASGNDSASEGSDELEMIDLAGDSSSLNAESGGGSFDSSKEDLWKENSCIDPRRLVAAARHAAAVAAAAAAPPPAKPVAAAGLYEVRTGEDDGWGSTEGSEISPACGRNETAEGVADEISPTRGALRAGVVAGSARAKSGLSRPAAAAAAATGAGSRASQLGRDGREAGAATQGLRGGGEGSGDESDGGASELAGEHDGSGGAAPRGQRPTRGRPSIAGFASDDEGDDGRGGEVPPHEIRRPSTSLRLQPGTLDEPELASSPSFRSHGLALRGARGGASRGARRAGPGKAGTVHFVAPVTDDPVAELPRRAGGEGNPWDTDRGPVGAVRRSGRNVLAMSADSGGYLVQQKNPGGGRGGQAQGEGAREGRKSGAPEGGRTEGYDGRAGDEGAEGHGEGRETWPCESSQKGGEDDLHAMSNPRRPSYPLQEASSGGWADGGHTQPASGRGGAGGGSGRKLAVKGCGSADAHNEGGSTPVMQFQSEAGNSSTAWASRGSFEENPRPQAASSGGGGTPLQPMRSLGMWSSSGNMLEDAEDLLPVLPLQKGALEGHPSGGSSSGAWGLGGGALPSSRGRDNAAVPFAGAEGLNLRREGAHETPWEELTPRRRKSSEESVTLLPSVTNALGSSGEAGASPSPSADSRKGGNLAPSPPEASKAETGYGAPSHIKLASLRIPATGSTTPRDKPGPQKSVSPHAEDGTTTTTATEPFMMSPNSVSSPLPARPGVAPGTLGGGQQGLYPHAQGERLSPGKTLYLPPFGAGGASAPTPGDPARGTGGPARVSTVPAVGLTMSPPGSGSSPSGGLFSNSLPGAVPGTPPSFPGRRPRQPVGAHAVLLQMAAGRTLGQGGAEGSATSSRTDDGSHYMQDDLAITTFSPDDSPVSARVASSITPPGRREGRMALDSAGGGQDGAGGLTPVISPRARGGEAHGWSSVRLDDREAAGELPVALLMGNVVSPRRCLVPIGDSSLSPGGLPVLDPSDAMGPTGATQVSPSSLQKGSMRATMEHAMGGTGGGGEKAEGGAYGSSSVRAYWDPAGRPSDDGEGDAPPSAAPLHPPRRDTSWVENSQSQVGVRDGGGSGGGGKDPRRGTLRKPRRSSSEGKQSQQQGGRDASSVWTMAERPSVVDISSHAGFTSLTQGGSAQAPVDGAGAKSSPGQEHRRRPRGPTDGRDAESNEAEGSRRGSGASKGGGGSHNGRRHRQREDDSASSRDGSSHNSRSSRPTPTASQSLSSSAFQNDGDGGLGDDAADGGSIRAGMRQASMPAGRSQPSHGRRSRSGQADGVVKPGGADQEYVGGPKGRRELSKTTKVDVSSRNATATSRMEKIRNRCLSGLGPALYARLYSFLRERCA
eukprot:jgi/Mesvir1/20780/Mv07892-RA.1